MWLVRLSGFVRSLSIILNHYVFYMTLHRIYSRHWQWLHLSLGETPFFSISSRIHDTIKSLKLFNLLWQEEMQCCFAMKLQKYIYWVFILGKVFLNCHCPYLFARNDTEAPGLSYCAGQFIGSSDWTRKIISVCKLHHICPFNCQNQNASQHDKRLGEVELRKLSAK